MPAGQTRFVDSSIERLQVRVDGFVEERYKVLCNGWEIPLRPTGTNGQFVGGIRYRAWQPPHCLQPLIGVHAPLTFDLVDQWNGLAIGGCTYHVSHPGGRNYERFPVNANEAEARRRARFFPIGHTPGPMEEPVQTRSREHPRTLDLRRGG